MTARDFCFWLQGYFEMRGSNAAPISEAQADLIKRHLALVFVHEIDPSMGDAEAQAKLNTVHGVAPPIDACVHCQHSPEGHAPQGCTVMGCPCEAMGTGPAVVKPKPIPVHMHPFDTNKNVRC